MATDFDILITATEILIFQIVAAGILIFQFMSWRAGNLIGEVRKAVFGATDYLGHELWRRYILKGLDLLVQVSS